MDAIKQKDLTDALVTFRRGGKPAEVFMAAFTIADAAPVLLEAVENSRNGQATLFELAFRKIRSGLFHGGVSLVFDNITDQMAVDLGLTKEDIAALNAGDEFSRGRNFRDPRRML